MFRIFFSFLFILDTSSALADAFLGKATSISAGGFHTCTIYDKGVKCWGYNKDGETDAPPGL